MRALQRLSVVLVLLLLSGCTTVPKLEVKEAPVGGSLAASSAITKQFIGVYPQKPGPDEIDLQLRRAYRSYKLLVNGEDRSSSLIIEFNPFQVMFEPPNRMLYSGEPSKYANPAPFGYNLQVLSTKQTWWFSTNLKGGAGGVGPARFWREEDQRPETERDYIEMKWPGLFQVFPDGSASPVAERDPNKPDPAGDPRGMAYGPIHNVKIKGRVTQEGLVYIFEAWANAIGPVIGGPEN